MRSKVDDSFHLGSLCPRKRYLPRRKGSLGNRYWLKLALNSSQALKCISSILYLPDCESRPGALFFGLLRVLRLFTIVRYSFLPNFGSYIISFAAIAPNVSHQRRQALARIRNVIRALRCMRLLDRVSTHFRPWHFLMFISSLPVYACPVNPSHLFFDPL